MKKIKKKIKKVFKYIILAFSVFKILVDIKDIFILFKELAEFITKHRDWFSCPGACLIKTKMII